MPELLRNLPQAPHSTIPSSLSSKYGKEVANYYSGSPLNRVSFLRNDQTFLSQALQNSTSRFVLFNKLEPLVTKSLELAYISFSEIQPYIGVDTYRKSEDVLIAEYKSSSYTPQLVFLGLDERISDDFRYKDYCGTPYFAVDVSPKGPAVATIQKFIVDLQDRGFHFGKHRLHSSFEPTEAAIFAEARIMIDWNARNPFCAQCGQPTLSVNAGFKRTCPPRDLSLLKGASSTTATQPASLAERPPCATRNGVSNLSFPRTDPTVIMAVLSSDGTRVLLVRQKKWPQLWYSTLAGFIEPGESVEEAVRRETWEESGIRVGRVVMHSTQPWPYPANLMIGAVGQAIPGGEQINLGNDAELESAKWVTKDELREALEVGTSVPGEQPSEKYKEGNLRLPPSTAIANQLLTAVIDGFASVTETM